MEKSNCVQSCLKCSPREHVGLWPLWYLNIRLDKNCYRMIFIFNITLKPTLRRCWLRFLRTGLLQTISERAGNEKNPPECLPNHDVRCAFREDRLLVRQHPPPIRGEDGGHRGIPVEGRGSEPGVTVTRAPPHLTVTAVSAMPLAGVDGWNWWKGRGPISGNMSPDSGSMRVKTGDMEEESKGAGSRRPACDRAVVPWSMRPDSARRVAIDGHSARSRSVRLSGPAYSTKSWVRQTVP